MKNKTYLLIFLFLFAFLIMFSTKVEASDVSAVPAEIKTFIEGTEFYNNSDYDFLCYTHSFHGVTEHAITFFKKSDEIKFYVELGTFDDFYNNEVYTRPVIWIFSDKVFEAHLYKLDVNYNLIRDEDITFDWTSYVAGTYSERDSYYYNSVDLYADDTYSTVFFLQTPLVRLMMPAEVQEVPKVVKKVVTILIRVGLIIFGILYVALALSSRILRKT